MGGDSQKLNANLEKNTKRKLGYHLPNAGNVFQSIWVRCRSIFSDTMDREFVESEFRFVLYCGAILWVIYLIAK
jgi:hypothetical protein